MPKHKPQKVPKALKKTMSSEWLRKALGKRTKAELVDVIMDVARANRGVSRELELQFGLEPPPTELVAATRQAIADATDFDEREINHNFSYDYAAYDVVKRNLGRLINLGHLRAAMELSLELMSEGSYQVEMSDEGLMTQDIEECLRIVIKALRKCDLPTNDVVTWCTEMTANDRIKCICHRELQALQDGFDAARSK